jgi:hypothetical protein
MPFYYVLFLQDEPLIRKVFASKFYKTYWWLIKLSHFSSSLIAYRRKESTVTDKCIAYGVDLHYYYNYVVDHCITVELRAPRQKLQVFCFCYLKVSLQCTYTSETKKFLSLDRASVSMSVIMFK